VRSFPTNSRPATQGHPRADLNLYPGIERASRRRAAPYPTLESWSRRIVVALPPGSVDVLPIAVPARGTLVMEPMLRSPTTTRTPEPPKRGLDAIQHDGVPPLVRHHYPDTNCRSRTGAMVAASGPARAAAGPRAIQSQRSLGSVRGRGSPHQAPLQNPPAAVREVPPIAVRHRPRTAELPRRGTPPEEGLHRALRRPP
jgi:hypothetical protein